jgi:thioredoxin-like negative regulator of GroEL
MANERPERTFRDAHDAALATISACCDALVRLMQIVASSPDQNRDGAMRALLKQILETGEEADRLHAQIRRLGKGAPPAP